MKSLLLSILLLSAPTFMVAQNYCHFSIQDLSQIPCKNEANILTYDENLNCFDKQDFGDHQFNINGVAINKSNNIFDVPVNGSDLDLLVVKFEKKTDSIYCRLGKGKSYYIKQNTCSEYEIYPVQTGTYKPLNKAGFTNRHIRFVTTNKISYLNIIGDFSNKNKEDLKRDTTNYHHVLLDIWCGFGTSQFSMLHELKNAKTYSRIKIHYLGDEKFTVHYDCKSDKFKITFDGHGHPLN
ncbi:MAG: hypothetical protein HRT71_18130 [Flavobacteriales bacterium]|nr:hypothetical protein [Flavobacteriales bacterium]